MRILPVLAAYNHVLRSTINNLGFAWHLSWPWMIVIMPLNILAGIYGFTFAPDAAAPSGEVIALTFLIALVTMFAFASIAVSWHRYILLDEMPQGLARLRADNTVWRYFGNTILIVLILAAALLPVFTVAAVLLSALGSAGIIIALPIYVAGFVLGISAFYRLSVKLPAVALERKDYGMKDAWKATEGNTSRFLGLAALFFLAVMGMALILGALAWLLEKTGVDFALFLSLAIQIVFNWIVTVMGVTLLTSLYGYFEEKREF
jgi:hypothetical protein